MLWPIIASHHPIMKIPFLRIVFSYFYFLGFSLSRIKQNLQKLFAFLSMSFPENLYSNVFRLLVHSSSMEKNPHQEDSSSQEVHHLELNFQWFPPPCSPKESLGLLMTMQADDCTRHLPSLTFKSSMADLRLSLGSK